MLILSVVRHGGMPKSISQCAKIWYGPNTGKLHSLVSDDDIGTTRK